MEIARPKPRRVYLFITCLADLFYPEVGEATVAILRRLGLTVKFPREQTCCGQPAFNSGFRRETERLAHHFIEVFEESDDYIVTPSGSCATMVALEYPGLFTDDPAMRARAVAVAARTFELSQFLVHVMGVEDLGVSFPITVTYHDACHACRTLGVREEPRRLLRHVEGLKLLEMERSDWCCGFGGTFAVRMPEISGAMVQQKVQRILATGAEAVVSTDLGCLMNIGGALNRQRLPVRALHLAQILAGKGH
jgi:L-lactate dehydrogenase complex protein LldE